MYVANDFRDLILTGKLKPRMRLKIDEAAELLKPARVALKDLEAEGPREGTLNDAVRVSRQ